MRKLLLLITVVLSIGISGCSKDSSTNKWDYSTKGLQKGDVVEFKIFPGTQGASSVVLNSVVYVMDLWEGLSGFELDYPVTNTSNAVLKRFTAQTDGQLVKLFASCNGNVSKTMLQIVVNGKVIEEGYLDNTYKSKTISIPKGL
ncbi:MAG: hypothetical protein Q8908_09110 [Bacteroidota bacterium]|nr:hypothetical protein [Bacteroidota bacterium]